MHTYATYTYDLIGAWIERSSIGKVFLAEPIYSGLRPRLSMCDHSLLNLFQDLTDAIL